MDHNMDRRAIGGEQSSTTTTPSSHQSSLAGASASTGTSSELGGLRLIPPEMTSDQYKALLSPDSSAGGTSAAEAGRHRPDDSAAGAGAGATSPPGATTPIGTAAHAPHSQRYQPATAATPGGQQQPNNLPTPTRSFDDSIMGSSVASSISSNTYTHLNYHPGGGFPTFAGGGFPVDSGQQTAIDTAAEGGDGASAAAAALGGGGIPGGMGMVDESNLGGSGGTSALTRNAEIRALQQQFQMQQQHVRAATSPHSHHQQAPLSGGLEQQQQQQTLQQHQQQHGPHPDATRALFRGYPSPSSSSTPTQDSSFNSNLGGGGSYAPPWTPGTAVTGTPLSELDTVYEIDGVVSRDDSSAAPSSNATQQSTATYQSSSGGEASPSIRRSPKASAAAAARKPLLPANEGAAATAGGVAANNTADLDTSIETVTASNIAGTESAVKLAQQPAGSRTTDHNVDGARKSPGQIGGGGGSASAGGDDDSAIALLHCFGGATSPISRGATSSPVHVDDVSSGKSSGAGSGPSWPGVRPPSLVSGGTTTNSDESGGDITGANTGGTGGTGDRVGKRQLSRELPADMVPVPDELLLGKFDVDFGDPLHYSRDEVSLRAVEYNFARDSRASGASGSGSSIGGGANEAAGGGGGDGGGASSTPVVLKGHTPRRVVLRLTNDRAGASAELEHRRGINPRSVLPILAAYADGDAVHLDDGGGTASSGGVKVRMRDGLAEEVRKCLATRVHHGATSAGTSSNTGNNARGDKGSEFTFRYLLVQEYYDQTLEDVLRNGTVDLSLARKIVKDVVLGLILLHTETIVHGDVRPRSIVRVDDDDATKGGRGSKWKLARLQSSSRFGGGDGRGKNRRAASRGGGGGDFGTMSPAASASASGAPGAGTKKRSWAHCPPEAAVSLLEGGGTGDAIPPDNNPSATHGQQPQPVPPPVLTPRARYVSDAAHDLWSLGCVLYRLILGRPLWNADRDGGLTQPDLIELARWSPKDLARRVMDWCHRVDEGVTGQSSSGAIVTVPSNEDGGGVGGISGDDVRPALDLIGKLLAPTPEDRRANFEFGIVSVHQHEFLAGRRLERSSLDLYQSRLDVLRRDAEEHAAYLHLTSELGLDERWELRRARDVLLLGAFEPTDGRIPTSFVVLKDRLPLVPPSSLDRRRGAAVARERLQEGLLWTERFGALEGSVRGALDGDISSIGRFWGKISGMFHGDYMYLYFIDELTGEPVLGTPDDEDDGLYPIEITTWSDVVPKLLPLMHLTMRAMALYHGVGGVARMFGAPASSVREEFPEELRAEAQSRIDALKTERAGVGGGEGGGGSAASSSVASPFGPIVDDVARLDAFKEQFLKGDESVRCQSLRELARFLEKKAVGGGWRGGGDGGAPPDAASRFAGLHRYPDERGRAIWTTLTDAAEVRDVLRRRSEERLKEEVCRWSTGRRDELDALQRDFFEERERGARLESELEGTRTQLAASAGMAGSLENQVVELEIALDHAREELGRARAQVLDDDDRSVVSRGGGVGVGMFKLKNYRKQKSKGNVLSSGKAQTVQEACPFLNVSVEDALDSV